MIPRPYFIVTWNRPGETPVLLKDGERGAAAFLSLGRAQEYAAQDAQSRHAAGEDVTDLHYTVLKVEPRSEHGHDLA